MVSGTNFYSAMVAFRIRALRCLRYSPVLVAVFVFGSSALRADELRVAVAANFVSMAQQLGRQFDGQSGHVTTFVPGSTGKHYAQIRNGAPFDIFLAADARRPELLEAQQLIVAGTRFTYALGRIVLWSVSDTVVDAGGSVFEHGQFRRLAIADPELAPYGRAAREVLVALGQWTRLEGRIVRGKNVSQAFQFVSTGNAELGIVAASQVLAGGELRRGSVWIIPESLYAPIRQQAVLLRDRPAGRAFMRFISSETARAAIRANGYGSL